MDERNQVNPQEGDEEKQFEAFLKQFDGDDKQVQEQPKEQEREEEGEAQPHAKQEPEQPKDWTDELPEQFRERVRQEILEREQRARDMESRWKAQAGQLAPVQRKLAELERLHKQAGVAQKPAGNPGGMNDADWERYKKEFPEESRIIESRLNPVAEQLRTVADELAALKRERETERAFESVREQHEDFDEIDNDPVFGLWMEDVKASDPIVARMLGKGRLDAGEVSWLITQYKRDLALANSISQQQQQSAVSAPNPRAQQAVDKRQQQKRDVPVRQQGQSARGSANAPVDPEEAEFAAFLEQNPP